MAKEKDFISPAAQFFDKAEETTEPAAKTAAEPAEPDGADTAPAVLRHRARRPGTARGVQSRPPVHRKEITARSTGYAAVTIQKGAESREKTKNIIQ